ncbi:MAG: hypothetical protein SGILL_000887 [Bacillariaceae sp.]
MAKLDSTTTTTPYEFKEARSMEEAEHSWKCHSNLTNMLENVHYVKDEYSYEDLQRIELQRREILQCVELPFWRILTFWNGTCLKALSHDLLIWVPITIYVAVRIQAHFGAAMPEMAELMSQTDTNILGGFLSFLLVLFVNQTNNRFFEMYNLARACGGRIQDIAGLAHTYLQRKQPERVDRLVRYLNSAQIAGYVGLSGSPYSQSNFFDPINEQHHMLTQQDLDRLKHDTEMNDGPACFKELIRWCHEELGLALEEGAISDNQSVQIQEKLLGLRITMDGIYNAVDQQPHFFYIHFLCLLSALYLPIFAVENAFTAGWGDESSWVVEILTGTIVILQSFFVVGLRLLGQKLADPFGDDLEDLSIMTYVLGTIKSTKILLSKNGSAPALKDETVQKAKAPERFPLYNLA